MPALGVAAAVLASGWGVRGARAEVAPPVADEPPPISGLLSLAVGRGLRFNNPYRLERPLGDIGAALVFGQRDFRHGASLGGDVALQGIGQLVLTPSYLAQFGLSDALGVSSRIGVPIVVAPDTSLGLEAAVGSNLALAYGLGAQLELVGSVYFGAATEETSITTIPMLSLQLGVFFEHGVSP
jgi:hypothetical protein